MSDTKSPIVWSVQGIEKPKPIEIKFSLREHLGRIDVLATNPSSSLIQTVLSFKDGCLIRQMLNGPAAENLGINVDYERKIREIR